MEPVFHIIGAEHDDEQIDWHMRFEDSRKQRQTAFVIIIAWVAVYRCAAVQALFYNIVGVTPQQLL